MRSRIVFVVAAVAAAWRPAPRAQRARRTARGSVPPNAWVEGAPRASSAELWLDLRDAPWGERAAEQKLLTLFYAVRRVVDKSGRALPAGRAVDACVYAEAGFERADAIGAGVPCYLQAVDGALASADGEPSAARLATAGDVASLEAALGADADAVAIPADPLLWAFALTGLRSAPDDADAGAESF